MVNSIDTIVDSILEAPKPVILFDTCALLDIVRSAERENISSEIISTALELITCDDKWLISCEVVDTEWKDNIDSVEIYVRNALRNLHKRALSFKGALDHSQSQEVWEYSKYFTSYELEKNLTSISNDLRGVLTLIDRDSDCVLRATDRTIKCIAPASKGKAEFKDCLIIEHFIELSNKLREREFSSSVVFVSSNKADFGSPFDIKEPLRTEFLNASIQYAGDIKSALRLCQ